MRKIVSVEKMRQIERDAIELLEVPSVILMENAGKRIADVVKEVINKQKIKKPLILVFCGSGNNAGDGFVAARHLYNNGYRVEVIMLKDPEDLKGDALINYKIIKSLRLKIKDFKMYNPAKNKQKLIIIDALLGTGIRGEISPVFKEAINHINNSEAFVVSADVPSGLDANTGKPHGAAVKADITVTMGAIKKGLLTASGRRFCGKIVVADIGIKI